MGDRNEVKVRYMDKLRVVEEKERKGWEEAWKELEEMGFSKEPPARSAKEGDGGEKVRFLDGLPVVKRRREGRGRLGDGLVRFPLLGRVGAMMPGPRAEAEAEGFVKEAHSETEEEKYVEPLPFPFPILHVGTDIVRISRIEQIMKDKLGRRFLKKLLTKEEALAMWTDGATVTTMRQNEWTLFWWEMVKWKKAERIAGRFAVKEAVMKAHPHRRLTFHDILVFNDKSPVPLGSAGNGVVSDRMERLGSGPPRVYVKGDKEGQPYQEVRVSISHDGDYATAVCMGVEVPPGR
ncbi:hypothetical protein QBC34DRAFT_408324 [Podospora aff. communis PSN243]|uniref:4'-phosphopantetheinyl transferase domain-containing protein n=1 Tax=Podospora aff. communis PSN243 TaxID=3040156 RepID=A0AAV9GJ14_9PEZI|nr:hypothetical protein QBC34DRAFT_408324 [Podospora aff. communis PSN243]